MVLSVVAIVHHWHPYTSEQLLVADLHRFVPACLQEEAIMSEFGPEDDRLEAIYDRWALAGQWWLSHCMLGHLHYESADKIGKELIGK